MSCAADEMKVRTKNFALRVLTLCNALPRTPAARVIGTQMLRSATSVGANYRAACLAKSKADFIAKIGIVLEEADETTYWLELLVESNLVAQRRLSNLIRESQALSAIFAASRKTAVEHPLVSNEVEHAR